MYDECEIEDLCSETDYYELQYQIKEHILRDKRLMNYIKQLDDKQGDISGM